MVCHNHWTVNGAKISKSKGNYIPLRRLRQFVPGELVRAYLLTEDTLQRDGDFATEHLLRMTKDLADLYGNLLMRSLGKAIATPVLQAGNDGTTVTEETTQRLQRLVAGVKERYDARDWTVWARSRFGPEVPIFLMGVSMGAATVLLAAGLNLPDNVCGIVADCGYTSPREITRKCLPEYLPGMPLELTYAVGRLGAILFGHFDPEDADCEAAAAQSKVPILFVHGDADGFVPYDMGKRNYEACRAKGKRFLTVHGAEHAVSYYHDNDAYTKQATEFLQDCLARRGFVWPPETDEPEK